MSDAELLYANEILTTKDLSSIVNLIEMLYKYSEFSYIKEITVREKIRHYLVFKKILPILNFQTQKVLDLIKNEIKDFISSEELEKNSITEEALLFVLGPILFFKTYYKNISSMFYVSDFFKKIVDKNSFILNNSKIYYHFKLNDKLFVQEENEIPSDLLYSLNNQKQYKNQKLELIDVEYILNEVVYNTIMLLTIELNPDQNYNDLESLVHETVRSPYSTIQLIGNNFNVKQTQIMNIPNNTNKINEKNILSTKYYSRNNIFCYKGEENEHTIIIFINEILKKVKMGSYYITEEDAFCLLTFISNFVLGDN